MKMTRRFEGKACSPGIGIGSVSVLPELFFSDTRKTIEEEETEDELNKFRRAIEQARDETGEIRRKSGNELYDQLSDLFSVQEMILDDPMFVDRVEKKITEKQMPASSAVIIALEELEHAFSEQLSDEATRGRMLDVVDVGWRALRHIEPNQTPTGLPHGGVLVARKLAPSMAVRLEETEIDALITSDADPGSHVSIVAQALEIPAISISDDEFFQQITPGDDVIVAANQDLVIVDPTENQRMDFSNARDRFYQFSRKIRERARGIDDSDLPCAIRGNLGLLSEIPLLEEHGGHGSGLVRTELLFMGKESDYPSVEKQKRIYRQLAESIEPFTATIRTFDVGGEKEAFPSADSESAQSGRGIYRSLSNEGPLLDQLRALLEVYSEYDNLKLLIPMVGGPGEIRAVSNRIDELAEVLDTELPPLGVMVEIPSIVYMLDDVMDTVDFLTVGTNDLMHYLMGADRFGGNEVDSVNAPNPALFRCLKTIFEKAHNHSCPVGVCGELAGNPVFTPVLIGLGTNEMSMAPIRIPEVKLVAEQLNPEQSTAYARRILEFDERRKLKEWVRDELAPEVEELMKIERT